MANNGCIVVSVVISIIAIIIISVIASSMKKIQSTEVGLKYEPLSKKLADDPTYEGLHVGTPGFSFIIVPSVFETLSFSYVQCLAKDGIEVKLKLSYQFRIDPTNLKSVIMQFRDFDNYKTVLRAFGFSSIHDACSHFLTTEFQSKRGEFQEALRNIIVDKYAMVHASITDLQVEDIIRPTAYENAVKSKENAREDIDVANSENPIKLTEAKTVELQAETEANITLNDAETLARIEISKAMVDAEAILNEYKREADSYKFLMSPNGLDMNVDSFLSYMAVRAIENAPNPVQVGIDSPAKTSYFKET